MEIKSPGLSLSLAKIPVLDAIGVLVLTPIASHLSSGQFASNTQWIAFWLQVGGQLVFGGDYGWLGATSD